MNKYRERPKEVEAIQYKGFESFRELEEFMGDFFAREVLFKPISEQLIIHTFDGTERRASIGDYIVKGEHGDFYPCKPDMFEAIYEKVR